MAGYRQLGWAGLYNNGFQEGKRERMLQNIDQAQWTGIAHGRCYEIMV